MIRWAASHLEEANTRGNHLLTSKRIARWTAAVGVAVGLGLLPALGAAQATEYQATLSGSTAATGTFSASIDPITGAGTFTLTVPSITATSAAHIHAGGEGESGPVVVGLFAAEGGSADSINASGSFVAADLGGPYADDSLGFVAAANNGTLYINVHTAANPGGEIRGQVMAVEAMAVMAPTTGNAGLTAAHGSVSGSSVALLLALAVALVIGGRIFTTQARTR